MTGPAAVFGRGISFPPRVGVGGRVAWSEGEPNNAATRHQVAERIRRAVADWEPRVTVEAVQVDPDPADPEVAVATVEYQLVATGEPVRLSVSIGLAG